MSFPMLLLLIVKRDLLAPLLMLDVYPSVPSYSFLPFWTIETCVLFGVLTVKILHNFGGDTALSF